MKLTVYDKKPGPGLWQLFLKTSWLVGCWLQKRLGLVDDYYGAESWDDAVDWLQKHSNIEHLQYWGHGSPGSVWLAEEVILTEHMVRIRTCMSLTGVVWFRSCSVFKGQMGHTFAKYVANNIQRTVASHTYDVGPWQSGLHTIKPGETPYWSLTEGNVKFPALSAYFRPWLPNTVFFLTTRIPEGW